MHKRHPFALSALLLASLAMAAPLYAVDVPASGAPAYEAITKPSKDRTISFEHPGRVEKVDFGLGDAVKSGQLIAKQDSKEEEAALAITEVEAHDETEVNADIAQRDSDKVLYDRVKTSGAGPSEVEEARMKVLIGDARIEIAKSKLKEAQLKLGQTKIALEKLTILAPFDGVIAEEFLKADESADGSNMKVVRIVQLDPLLVEVPVPILHARKLTKDDPAVITTSDGKERPGKVTVIAPVADAASGTMIVRVEVPNPEKISAGENVSVRFGPLSPVQVGAASPKIAP